MPLDISYKTTTYPTPPKEKGVCPPIQHQNKGRMSARLVECEEKDTYQYPHNQHTYFHIQ
jgi:hypothetical protein